jgi:large subunit ribosomal protein L15
MRLPKFGFNSAKARVTAEVTLSEIASVGMETIDLQTLIKADLLKGTIKRAKVILSGKIERAVTIKGLRVTKGAKAKIEAAGGSVVE